MSEQKTDPAKKRKEGRINNTLHLWEFLLELLEDDRYTPLISWTRKEEGEFKIKRQEDVARKWGQLKQRASMNYDKLSRSLRYYYHKGIIKKVQGQRLVYKFDKLPYVYKPVKYNWPWKLPSEEKDKKPVKLVKRANGLHSMAKHEPAMSEWRFPNSEGHVNSAKMNTVTTPDSKATPWPVLSAWKIPVSEQDPKQVKPDNVPPLVAKHLPVTSEWRLPSSEGHVNPAKTDTVTFPFSKATPWPVLSTWKIPVSEQDPKRVKPDNIPPLVPIATPLTVVPALNPGTRSPILSQSVTRHPHSAFRSVHCPSQRPSPVTTCRSKIIFPPCSCMGSAVCGVRMISNVKSIPVKVITRYI